MATSNTSAVLDVVTESKDISSMLRESKSHDKLLDISKCTPNNSLSQTSSVESLTAVQDVENLSELHVDENSDICVKIDHPQKHLETLETYITFRIITKVARIEFSENEYIVRRRYNDFVWIRQKLQESHPFCIIPPLPGKHSLMGQLDRYSKDFILSRMKALNIFISRVIQHPILSCNENLKVFLTAKQSEFNVYRRQRCHTETNKIRSLSGMNLAIANATKNRHLEFDKTKVYLTTLSEKLSAIEKISSRICRDQSDYVTELNNFHPIFTSWSNSEPEFRDVLQNIGAALERSTAAQVALLRSHYTTIIEPVKDFLAYIEVVQETLKKREHYQSMYENCLDELNKKYNERDKLITNARNNPSQNHGGFSLWKQATCDEKLEKLGSYIPQLLKKVESHQDNLECANEMLRSDLQRWQQEKQQCLKKILIDFINKQVDYYHISYTAWEDATKGITLPKVVVKNSTPL